MCIEKLHPACPDLKNFKFEAGVDKNGNGSLEASQKFILIDEQSPGPMACAAATSGNAGPGKKGKDLLWHYECGKEGQDGPFVSKNGEERIQ